MNELLFLLSWTIVASSDDITITTKYDKHYKSTETFISAYLNMDSSATKKIDIAVIGGCGYPYRRCDKVYDKSLDESICKAIKHTWENECWRDEVLICKICFARKRIVQKTDNIEVIIK